LVTEPQLLLLDEPLAALDPRARRELRTLLVEQVVREVPLVLFVSHDVRDVSALGGTVAVLDRGRVVQQGTVEALATAPANDFVAEFFAPLALQRA
jgi:ABC-type sulfate/molybdate transport systems ATPase subunit